MKAEGNLEPANEARVTNKTPTFLIMKQMSRERVVVVTNNGTVDFLQEVGFFVGVSSGHPQRMETSAECVETFLAAPQSERSK